MTKQRTQAGPFPNAILLTHLGVGSVGMLAAVPFPWLGQWGTAVVVALAVVLLAVVLNWLAVMWTKNGLGLIENAVVTGENPPGSSEFHKVADSLVTHVSRLASVAAKGREQRREVESVLSTLDRRGSADTRNPNPMRQLGLLLNSIGGEARAALQRAFSIGADLDTVQAQIENVNEEQSGLVENTTNEIAQLTKCVETVSSIAKASKTKDEATTDVIETVSAQLIDLQQLVEGTKDLIVKCEARSQSLRDQTSEISSLVHAIAEHSTKTDTMALNASIESVRAGEHGRGFAAAADEIRKLTAVITDSAQAVLEQMDTIEESVDGTTVICSGGHVTIEEQLSSARELAQAMSELRKTNHYSRKNLDLVLQTTEEQLQSVSAIGQTLDELRQTFQKAKDGAKQEHVASSEMKEALSSLSQILAPLSCDPESEDDEHPLEQSWVMARSQDEDSLETASHASRWGAA